MKPTRNTPLITICYALLVVLMLCIPTRLSAQEWDEFDYRNYKFYEETEPTPWYLLADTVLYQSPSLGFIGEPLTEVRYALSAVDNPRRGFGYEEERYMVDMLSVDRATSRLLSAMGFRGEVGAGLIHAPFTGGVTLGTQHSLSETIARSYEHHYLRGELSGRSYIGGLSYSTTLIPVKDRPALKDDWVVRLFARARAGRDIYVEGVYTESAELAASIGRSRRNDSFVLLCLLPFSERGLRRASTEEAYTLTGNPLYNPSWGMQDGRVRNSRVATTLRPEVIAAWQRRLTVTTKLNLAADISFERGGYSTLAWFDAMTPEPDNYRYMPSYQRDESSRREVEDAWRGNDLCYTQIDWASMFHTNALQRDGEAAYILENRRDNNYHTAINLSFCSEMADLVLRYGADLYWHGEHRFKVAEDMLGADHIVDMDYFLIDDATYSNSLRNNTRDDNPRVEEGERFGYNYLLSRHGLALHAIVEWRREYMSLVAALRFGGEQSLRYGYYEKELFSGDGSYGRSKVVSFAPYRLNVQWSTLLGQHSLRAALMLRGESPSIDNLYLQTQYNNRVVDNPRLRHTLASEFCYGYSADPLSLSTTLFLNYGFDDSRVLHYYDDLARLYSDVVVSAIDRLGLGVEASMKVQYIRQLSSTFALTAALYQYADDAEVSHYADADNHLVARTKSLLRGCHDSTPAITAYGDVAYKNDYGWSVTLSAEYWGVRYVELSAVRRTVRVLSYSSSDEEALTMAKEQRLSDAVTIDLSVGKRFKFHAGNALYLRFAVRNLLGSTIIQRGAEQHRIRRFTAGGVEHVEPFDNRLSYAYPRQFYLSVGFSF